MVKTTKDQTTCFSFLTALLKNYKLSLMRQIVRKQTNTPPIKVVTEEEITKL